MDDFDKGAISRDQGPLHTNVAACPLHMTHADVRKLIQLVDEHENLQTLIRFHTALVVISHTLKWLAGIAAAIAVLKGLDLW
ncbi:MAG: hypothetical protein EA355_06675 [Rhodobacteraceae bacterium]|nr:MAG: hypothetical protein EA355_06675 [Paracoccaceae bacterium]